MSRKIHEPRQFLGFQAHNDLGLGVKYPVLGAHGSGECGYGFLSSEAGTFQSIRVFERMLSQANFQVDKIFQTN